MALPEQIRKQTEAVKELYAQVNAEEATGEDQTVVEQPEADEPSSEDHENTSQTLQADDAVGDDAAHSSEPKPEKSKDAKADEETLMQKYRTLQGMYNAEVPRLHAQNKDLTQRLQQMEQLLSTLSSEQKQTSQDISAAPESLVSDQDIEEYGESIDVMRKVSREEYLPVTQKIAELERYLEQLQKNVVPQVNNLTQQYQATTEQQFWSQLSTAVPNWRETNDDPDFQTWLLERDPLVGITRQTMLEDAQRNLDAARVAQFFTTWQELNGGVEAKATQNSQRSDELEKQVAPGRARNSSSTTASNQKTYSPADIQKFFTDVQRGKYKGREKERDRIERDIFAAQKDGRIVVNS